MGSVLSLFWVCALAAPAFAALNPVANRGVATQKYSVPNGDRQEICVVPRHLPDFPYGAEDEAHEKALCDLDFYDNKAAVCPKLNSTNPGLDIHTIPQGFTLHQVTEDRCMVKDPKSDPKKPEDLAKKIAKYKLSTSCSYTPSLLSYYHVSRFLGGILNVPVAVIRTVDLKNHIALGEIALREAPRGQIIAQTWRDLMYQLTLGARAPKRDLLLTDTFDQSYGALTSVPKGDQFTTSFITAARPTKSEFRYSQRGTRSSPNSQGLS